MSCYVLAPAAQEDLVAIRDYYLEEADYRIARKMLAEFVKAFQTIARTPGVGRKREDLAGSTHSFLAGERLPDRLPIRQPVEIVTIAHASRDIAVILKRRD